VRRDEPVFPPLFRGRSDPLATEEHSILDQRTHELLVCFFCKHNLGSREWCKDVFGAFNPFTQQQKGNLDEAGIKRGGMSYTCNICVFYFQRSGFTAYFFGKPRNLCMCALPLCLDSLFFSFVCLGCQKLGAILPGFLCCKSALKQKKSCVCARMALVLFSVVVRFLERASTRRSLALFTERGSFHNLWALFLFCKKLPFGTKWIRHRHFFPFKPKV
jgi:hypothetical protein